MRHLLLALLAAVLFIPTGCNTRKPPPVVELQVLAQPGRWLYNGEEIGEATLKRELNNIADEHGRHKVTGGSRIRVHIVSPYGANDRRAKEMWAYCESIGLNNVMFGMAK